MNRKGRLLSRILLLACGLPLLTGASCQIEEHAGWLLANRRNHPLRLTLRGAQKCWNGDNLSDEGAFGPAERVVVRAQDKVWLTYNSGYDGVTQQRCGAIWISAEGGLDLVLAWDATPEWEGDDDTTPYSVIVEGPKDALVLHVPDGLVQLPPPGAKLLWVPAK